jgi:hypothetical protein
VNPLLHIPEHWHFLSAISLADRSIAMRLVPDIRSTDAKAEACALRAHRVHNADGVLRFLKDVEEANECVCVQYHGNELMVETERGGELVIAAESFTAAIEPLTSTECTDAVQRLYSRYVSENEANQKLWAKLQKLQSLLSEQARRAQVKAASHESSSSVGVLYAQHLRFIERLLRETET